MNTRSTRRNFDRETVAKSVSKSNSRKFQTTPKKIENINVSDKSKSISRQKKRHSTRKQVNHIKRLLKKREYIF